MMTPFFNQVARSTRAAVIGAICPLVAGSPLCVRKRPPRAGYLRHHQFGKYRHAGQDQGKSDVVLEAGKIEPGDTDEDREGGPVRQMETR